MNASDLQKKLSDSAENGPTDRLAKIAVASLMNARLDSVVTAAQGATIARDVLKAWLASEAALPTLERHVEWLVDELKKERRPLGELTDSSMKAALREVLGRPVSPDRKLVLTLIDRKPMRELVRQLLTDALLDFGKRASAPVAGMARGLGSLARMAGESVKARSGGLGSLVGAVSGEVERQLEKRTVEFVESALGGIFGKIADAISDPKRAHEAAELRLAMFEGVLELTPTQLARELMNADVPGGAKTLRDGLKRWAASEQSAQLMKDSLEKVGEREGAKSVKDLLNDFGIADAVEAHLVQFLKVEMLRVFGGDAFGGWLSDVMTE